MEPTSSFFSRADAITELNSNERTHDHMTTLVLTLNGKINKFDREKIHLRLEGFLDLQSLSAAEMASRLLKLSSNFRTLSQVPIDTSISTIRNRLCVNF